MNRPAVQSLLRGQSSIAIGMAVMNFATYGYTMVSARWLGPGAYGAFAALLATLLVVSVVQLGLQTTAARRIAGDPAHVAQIERTIMRVTYRASLLVGFVLLAAAPLLDVLLRLESIGSAVLLALTAIPLTVMGGQAGILQGERRWWPLAVMYMATGLSRLGLGTALLWWQPSEFNAMVAVAVSCAVPTVLGWYALRAGRPDGATSATHRARPLVREALHNSGALFAFFALSNIDIIIARTALNDHDSGLYAGGLIVTKAVLFLPQFIVVIAFPAMSNSGSRRSALIRGLLMVLALGGACSLGALLLPGLTLTVFGGAQFAEIKGLLWLFALLGTLLAMLQLLVYDMVARQGRRSLVMVTIGLAALALGVYLSQTLAGVLGVVLAVDAVLTAALLAVSLWLVREPAHEHKATGDS